MRNFTIKPGTSIYFATPCYGGMVTAGFLNSFSALQSVLERTEIQFKLATIVNESLITRGRNTLVAQFLGLTKFTHLMFIDADISFPVDSVFKLLHHDLDVVAGAYPTKNIDWTAVQRATNLKSTPDSLAREATRYALYRNEDQEIRGDLVEVCAAGTGFLLIKRGVFEKMLQHYPHLSTVNQNNFPKEMEPYLSTLFDTCLDEHRNYLSEDYTFCERWRKMGGRVWIDRTIELNHIGTFVFQGATERILQTNSIRQIDR